MARCIAVLSGLAFIGCATEERIDEHFSKAEWAFVQTFRLPPLDPCPPELGLDAARCDDAARLGQELFFDRRFSGPLIVGDDGRNGGLGAAGEPERVACSDCHQPDAWFTDRRSWPAATSLGADWTGRNAPSLVNVAYQDAFLWDGTIPTLAPVIEIPLKKPMNSSPELLAQVVWEHYRDRYNALFDPDLPPWLMLTTDQALSVRDNIGVAFAAYERRLVSGDAPLDRYLDGDTAAISESAKRGLALFIGPALCSECHHGPLLGGGGYHNTGVSQHRAGADVTHVPAVDRGRARVTGLAEDEGRFRTPSLRQVAETAPYMHGGQIETLAGVLDFYRWGGDPTGFDGTPSELMRPLEIDDDDVRDLEAFLRTLTGTAIPAELRR